MMRFLRATTAVSVGAFGSQQRHIGHGQDLAGVRRHHHRHAGVRFELVHSVRQLALRDMLERRVDRELNLRAYTRERPPPPIHSNPPPPRVALDVQSIHLATQHRIELPLDALQALSVDTCKSQHLACERAVRVVAHA